MISSAQGTHHFFFQGSSLSKNNDLAHGRVTNLQTYQRPTGGNLRKTTSLFLSIHHCAQFSSRLQT